MPTLWHNGWPFTHVFVYVCLNRYQRKALPEIRLYMSWKMITRRETYFMILAVALGSVSAFHCPMNQACTCQLNDGEIIEINCLTKNDSMFIMNIQPSQFIKVSAYLVMNVLHCLDIVAKLFILLVNITKIEWFVLKI